MSKYKDVAKLFDLELYEIFYVKQKNGDFIVGRTPSGIRKLEYHFSESGLFTANGGPYANDLMILLDGDWEVVKLPFKPTKMETYWFHDGEMATETTWCSELDDYCRWKLGNCFRTNEEAETKGKAIIDAIAKEFEGE